MEIEINGILFNERLVVTLFHRLRRSMPARCQNRLHMRRRCQPDMCTLHIRSLACKVLDKPRVHRDGSEIEYRRDRDYYLSAITVAHRMHA